MLQSSHFESTTKFRDGTIHFDYYITRAERALFASASGKSGDGKRATRIVINPALLSLDELRTLMIQAGRYAPEAYDAKWLYNEKEQVEGQRLVAIAYEGDTPVGYAAFRIRIGHAPGRKTIRYLATVDVIYVDPRHRGRGFGIDLSCATGLVCAEVLHALLKAAPKNCEIRPVMHAEFVTDGRAAISRSIRDTLEFAREMADDPRCQKEIVFEAV
jgi:GNAT superfamily N-acetyltransferase